MNTLGPRSRLSERIAQRYFDFEPETAAARASGGNATGRIIGQRRMSLTARELSLPDTPVHVYTDGARRCEVLRERKSGAIGFNNCAGFAPFEIGTDVLRQLRIYIASGGQRIYITRNGKSGSPVANGADRAAAADPAGDDAPATDPAAASAAAAATAAGAAPGSRQDGPLAR